MLNKIKAVCLILFSFFFIFFISNKIKANPIQEKEDKIKVIHTLVALCDNKYQRIVPVPEKIGNGEDLVNNLYWGAAFGVKSYFKKLSQWKLLAEIKDPKLGILERIIFRNEGENVYLVADAYKGQEIKQCIVDFLEYSSGNKKDIVSVRVHNNKINLPIGGNADLITYTGHNGLMDFKIDNYPKKIDENKRDVVILACASRNYFQDPILKSGANPILWTTGFMAPESYVLEAAINSWISNEGLMQIRLRAATAYNKYQKCGIKGALNLFSSSW